MQQLKAKLHGMANVALRSGGLFLLHVGASMFRPGIDEVVLAHNSQNGEGSNLCAPDVLSYRIADSAGQHPHTSRIRLMNQTSSKLCSLSIDLSRHLI